MPMTMEQIGELVTSVKATIAEIKPHFDEKLGKIEAQGNSLSERQAALEAAQKTISEAWAALKHRIPAGGSVRDAIFGSREETLERRAQLNAQMRFIAANDSKKFDGAEAKALTIAVGPSGGFLVPVTFQAEVMEKLYKTAVVYPNVDVVDPAPLQGNFNREDGDFTWANLSELQDATEIETAFTDLLKNLSWNLRTKAAFATLSNDLLRFAPFDIAGFMSRKAARSLGKKQDQWFWNGTGAGEPRGVRMGQGFNSVNQLAAMFSRDDLIELEFALPQAYRATAALWLSDTGLKLITKLKDSQERPLFITQNQMGVAGLKTDYKNYSGMIQLGQAYPYFLLDDVAQPNDLGDDADETEIWLGVGEQYRAFSDGVMEASQDSTGTNWRKGQTQVKFEVKYDGTMVQGEAWARLAQVKTPAS